MKKKESTLMLFQNVETLDLYAWFDREYPISFDGKTGRTKPWHHMGKDLDEETKEFFNNLAAARTKRFTIEGRGEFQVLKRTKYKYETHDITESE